MQMTLPEKERRKRIHRKTIIFNSDEQKLIDSFCKRYGVKNRAKLFREAIITVMLQKMEQDHPTLF
jgi:metal-responsive CopG/Arc/MetJ family transcriptional regulator